jgi:hypothetical protein
MPEAVSLLDLQLSGCRRRRARARGTRPTYERRDGHPIQLGQALQPALFIQASAAPIGTLALPFEIQMDQEAFIPLAPGR